jgi:hypothetical protein
MSLQKETAMADTERLNRLRALNPGFADAERKGEAWAVQRAEMVRGIDGKAGRRHPERAAKEDGKPRNWCGTCLHPEGCVTCDLDGSHEVYKLYGAHKTT